MSSPNRIAPLVRAVVVVVAGLLVGCAGPAPDRAAPYPNSVSTSDTVTTTSNATAGVFGHLDPCVLLTARDIAHLGAEPGERKDPDDARACVWRVPDTRAVFGVAIRPYQGLHDLNPGRGTLSDQRVGRHTGLLLTEFDGTGACAITIKITDTARVDINTAANDDTTLACHYTSAVALLIEPQLPRAE